MKLTAITLLGLAVSSTVAAQGSFTSPTGLAQVEGNGISANSFPSFVGARVQYLDGNQRGTPRPNIRAMRLRRDSYQLTNTTATARTLDLGVVMAHTTQATPSTTFASNYLNGLSTTVYTIKPTNIPDLRTQGPFPAPFSFQVLYDVMFNYNGTDDLLWETVARNNTNTGIYYFDHATNASIAGGGTGGFSLNGWTGCLVPPNTTQWLIAGAGLGTSAANVATVQWYTNNFGPISSPGALALGLSDPNISGVLCAPLRTSAEIVIPMSTTATGSMGTSTAPVSISFPFPGGSPFNLYAQFAAVDVPNSALYLSEATAETLVPYSTPVTRLCSAVRVFGAGADVALTGAASTFCMVAEFVY